MRKPGDVAQFAADLYAANANEAEAAKWQAIATGQMATSPK